jgi:hypothetical protein
MNSVVAVGPAQGPDHAAVLTSTDASSAAQRRIVRNPIL